MSDNKSSPGINISYSQSAGEKRNYPLVPDDFRNEIFDQNLSYFESHQPDIYNAVKKHRCSRYRLCINPDGSPNMVQMSDKALLYYSEAKMNENAMGLQLEHLPYAMEVSPIYTMTFKQEWYERNEITRRLYQSLYDLGPIKILADENSRKDFNDSFKHSFIPYLRIYGVGTGDHILRLIQTKEIFALLIYEPEIDIFYLSLYTTPWHLVFKYMALEPGRRLSLIIGSSPVQAIEQEKRFLHDNFPFIQLARWTYKQRQTPAIDEFIERENQAYYMVSANLTAGWYEDQLAGLVNCIGNIIAGKKFFTGKQVSGFMRIAIVGGGPSLDESVEYLKQHMDDFLIFACGTAITALVKNGVIPDFHIHQERTSVTDRILSWADVEDYRSVVALKLNVIRPELDALYKDAYIFQKYNDPGSSLLPERFKIIKHVTPTVTNSAIAFAGQLGADEVYLFGVDYGAGGERDRMHANHYVYADRPGEKVDPNSRYKLKGNFGDTVISTGKLMQSHSEAEVAISAHSGSRWFNLGDGAYIKGAKPLKVGSLSSRLKKKINKPKLLAGVKGCFDNRYSREEIVADLESKHGETIAGYFTALREFTNVSPTSRSVIVQALALLYQAIDQGKGVDHYLPHKLYASGFKRYIENVFLQNNMFTSDDEAVEFFHATLPVLQKYVDDLEEDAKAFIDGAKQQLADISQ